MLRTCLLLVGLLAANLLAGGCRSCSDCHDYDPPVANCDCNAYGTHRAGSACGCGGCGGSCGCESGGYYQGESVRPQQHAAPTEVEVGT
ncbi:MAG: hypothetical protein L0228_03815 [Planctomycetes bacterium]|nr:hypothetical protein [Planctomycetota bacterium]